MVKIKISSANSSIFGKTNGIDVWIDNIKIQTLKTYKKYFNIEYCL